MRQTDLTLRIVGSSSSGRGVEYPVVVRNKGAGTFWDTAVCISHDGVETDRKVVDRIGPESESEPINLLVPSRLCDAGTPGVGLRPLGRVKVTAFQESEAIAAIELQVRGAGQPSPKVDRVPRTPEEEAVLLSNRQPGWEYLLYAAILHRGVVGLEPKYRDHELRYVHPGYGSVLSAGDALGFVSVAFQHVLVLLDNFNRVLDTAALEAAFGPPGTSGDSGQIAHLANRLVDFYEGLLDWAARLRATHVESAFVRAVELSSSFVDLPIEQFRDFVRRTVAEVDRVPALLRDEAKGAPPRIEIVFVLSTDEELGRELHAELERLERVFSEQHF